MKLQVEVTQLVEVELDEAKFTETFMKQFRAAFYPFYEIEDHAKHIAQLQARGLIDIELFHEFIEGYGPSKDMGLRAVVKDTTMEMVS